MHALTPDQIPEKWGDIAIAYEKAFEKLTFQFAEHVLSKLELQPDERLLDVAAGTGAFSLAAAKQGADVLATDFAEGMVNRIRQRIEAAEADAPKIGARVMNGEALELDDACFDVSVSIVGLIFFPDIDKGFAELKRVLKPGGRCAVVCWDFPENFDMMKLLKQAIANAVPEFEMPTQAPIWARLVGEQALHDKLQQAGFSKVDVQTIDGLLKIESAEDFWSLFIASSPPMISLFAALGEDNTKRAGEEFARLATRDYATQGHTTQGESGAIVTLASKACVGIAHV